MGKHVISSDDMRHHVARVSTVSTLPPHSAAFASVIAATIMCWLIATVNVIFAERSMNRGFTLPILLKAELAQGAD